MRIDNLAKPTETLAYHISFDQTVNAYYSIACLSFFPVKQLVAIALMSILNRERVATATRLNNIRIMEAKATAHQVF